MDAFALRLHKFRRNFLSSNSISHTSIKQISAAVPPLTAPSKVVVLIEFISRFSRHFCPTMMIPVSQHKLIKISPLNRCMLTQLAFGFSTIACLSIIFSATTNNWLYTSEVLKYFVYPNASYYDEKPSFLEPTYYKNATLGPWLFCWLDPITPFHCQRIDYFSTDEPSDVTSSVEISVRKAFIFMSFGVVLDAAGTVLIFICMLRRNPYRSLLSSALIHIFAGMAKFACIIVYMASVSKEVGNKLYPETRMDDPLFHYAYGYSLISLKVSFLSTEVAALLSVIVYMAKRDEKIYNKYHIRSLFKTTDESPTIKTNGNIVSHKNGPYIIPTPDRYYEHSRMNSLIKKSRSMSSADDSFSDYCPKSSPSAIVKHRQTLLLPTLSEENAINMDHLRRIVAANQLVDNQSQFVPSININQIMYGQPNDDDDTISSKSIDSSLNSHI